MMKYNKTTFFLISLMLASSCAQRETGEEKVNLAVIAEPSTSLRYGRDMNWLNDGLTPMDVDQRMRRFRRRRPPSAQWIQYTWDQPVATDEISLFLFDYDSIFPLPHKYSVKYWNGEEFVPVKNISEITVENKTFNTVTFEEVETTMLRVETDSAYSFPANVLEWVVYKTKDSPPCAPIVSAGVNRSVITGGKTYLSGSAKSVTPVDKFTWSKVSGPGKVLFENRREPVTTATFSEPGEYILRLTARENRREGFSELLVKAVSPPPEDRLDVVYTKKYSINNPLWNDRIKAIIVNWIPHCISQIERTDLEIGQGGLDNFIEAAKALRGEPHGRHKGYVFSNAWVHQTVESMCLALMVDPQGDPEIIQAQELMKRKLQEWIPIILAAQEPDGYLHTAYTLRDTSRWKNRWEKANRTAHEGYVAGYFIESAINHYTLTNGTDTRLYDAAKKLADCWVNNIGPDKKEWWDEHQEMEQALVRFGRFVNDMEGNGRGDSYIQLAKFLLDCRGGGNEYSQSHVPVQQQYEAVGHAVRAAYSYSGMADVAAETGDIDYQSAVISLWDNIVNKKYYVTGGIGSGETSEGFGPNYSLPQRAYCESCSSCGLIFFQYKMNLAYHDARYADLYEETMYNALLGSLDLEGKNFYYTNPLITNSARYPWHVCPCCVGNIPRTLLMIPTWTYVKGNNGIYVNLFNGSTVVIEEIAGTDVEMVQKTDYPWDGKVSITVNPLESKEFSVFIRNPNRTTSELYQPEPEVKGILSLTINGKAFVADPVHGYTEIRRMWEPGDKITFELPLEIQKITPIDKVAATRGQVAFRYGPLIYNVEEADQPNIDQPVGQSRWTTRWNPDLLHGVITLHGTWADGSPLTAIPNFARANRDADPDPERIGTSKVWIDTL